MFVSPIFFTWTSRSSLHTILVWRWRSPPFVWFAGRSCPEVTACPSLLLLLARTFPPASVHYTPEAAGLVPAYFFCLKSKASISLLKWATSKSTSILKNVFKFNFYIVLMWIIVRCSVLLLNGPLACYWSSLYLDKNGDVPSGNIRIG